MTTVEFNQAVAHLDGQLEAYAQQLVRGREAVDDLVRETISRARWNHVHYASGTNFKAWILAVMRNVHRAGLRKRSAGPAAPPPVVALRGPLGARTRPVGAGASLSPTELRARLDEMDPAYSLPFTMHYTGYRNDEIARHLALPVGTVRERIFWARRKLQRSVEAGSRV